MANGWERLLRSLQEKTLGGAAEVPEKKPEAVTPEETPQGDSAVVKAAPSDMPPVTKRTRKTKPKVEQQAADEQDV